MRLFTIGFMTMLPASIALAQTSTYPLDSLEGLRPNKLKVEPVTYQGRRAIHLTDATTENAEDRLVVIHGTKFQDGVIEVELAGKPGAGAAQAARGFVGIAFRVAADLSRFECFYLRPTNGRAEDQERRNHSTQYMSFPGWPWMKLRQETPSKYESYVDLAPGAWTKVKIEVRGEKARLYVHGVDQPALLVNDLKMGASASGNIALWTGPGTEAYFSGLRVSK
ncbi:MAG: hypothetical protein JJE04_05455 [Acidobacteriia bacterium]|nr:hypothetical protein [Terriglobia bacterium]